MTETCKTCKFYKESPLRESHGVCRRYAPTLRKAPYHDSPHPYTTAYDYCGEYKEYEE